MNGYDSKTTFNKDALRMADWLLDRHDKMTTTKIICGEFPWLNELDVYAAVCQAMDKRKGL